MKVNRHAKIIELINKHQIETQEELAAYLNQEGFKVTQATVSRDIRDLKLTKVPAEDGKQFYAVHQSGDGEMGEKYIRVLREGFLSMDMAQNILVIKTVTGMANAVCVATVSYTHLDVYKRQLLNYAFETAFQAFSLAPEETSSIGRALQVLGEKAGIRGMIGGQVIDVGKTGQAVEKEVLDTIYELKTGALIEASMMVGAILAGASEELSLIHI